MCCHPPSAPPALPTSSPPASKGPSELTSFTVPSPFVFLSTPLYLGSYRTSGRRQPSPFPRPPLSFKSGQPPLARIATLLKADAPLLLLERRSLPNRPSLKVHQQRESHMIFNPTIFISPGGRKDIVRRTGDEGQSSTGGAGRKGEHDRGRRLGPTGPSF